MHSKKENVNNHFNNLAALHVELAITLDLMEANPNLPGIHKPTEEYINVIRYQLAKAQALVGPVALKYAALCRCVLDPHGFDNNKFWEQIYKFLPFLKSIIQKKLENLDYSYGAQVLDYRYGAPVDGKNIFFLGQSIDGALHYFACWPSVFSVITLLSNYVDESSAIDIINACCIDDAYRIKKKDLLQHHEKCPGESNNPKETNQPGFSQSNAGGSLPFKDNFSIIPFPMPGFLGHPIQPQKSLEARQETQSTQGVNATIMLKILGGFIAALGALAIVLAFTVLFPPVTIATVAVAATGVAAIVTGIGLFTLADKKAPAKLQEGEVTAYSLY